MLFAPPKPVVLAGKEYHRRLPPFWVAHGPPLWIREHILVLAAFKKEHGKVKEPLAKMTSGLIAAGFVKEDGLRRFFRQSFLTDEEYFALASLVECAHSELLTPLRTLMPLTPEGSLTINWNTGMGDTVRDGVNAIVKWGLTPETPVSVYSGPT